VISLNNIEELTDKVIRRVVENHRSTELPRLQNLENYYNAKNIIMNRLMKDASKPNNKIANAYASYITDTLVGYFIGEPVAYTSNDEVLLQDLNMIFEYNDEADENAELAKNASIYGVAYELLYLSEEDKMIRFKALNPKEIIPIFDKTIEQNLLAVLRYYDDYDVVHDKTYTIVELIDNTHVRRYKLDNSLSLLEEYQHYFQMVPVAVFKNNEEERGDFEAVISLIDAYDKMESDTLNDFEYFVDAYLALYGFTADADDVAQMKENRILLMDENTKAEWLIKQTSDVYVENMKNRLDKDIHKFAKCPNMSDQEFASNASGVAIKFKLLGTENLVSIKERKFKRGLQQRLELMSMINGVLRESFDWRAIDITFTRNIPSNDTDIANMVNTLRDIVSEETLLAQIPFVEDVHDELERLKQEREENKELNPFFSTGLNYQTEAMNKQSEEVENVEE
jgi:SPP1 family phage portal protein